MRFKDLRMGQRFRFRRDPDLGVGVIEHGPWIKRSARTYYKDTTPFGTDEQAREHEEWNGLHNEVGSIVEEVVALSPTRDVADRYPDRVVGDAKDRDAHDGRSVYAGYDYDRQEWCDCTYCKERYG